MSGEKRFPCAYFCPAMLFEWAQGYLRLLLKLVFFKIGFRTAFRGNKIEDFSAIAAANLLIFVFLYRRRTTFGTAHLNGRRFLFLPSLA